MEEQKHLFEIIKSKLSGNLKLSVAIEELLDVGADSAYRRIRGEKELSLSELTKICDRFNLSMDEILNYRARHGPTFHYTPINLLNRDSYIEQLERLLKTFDAIKAATNKEIIYTARSIPFYHFFLRPKLSFLSLYTWNNTLNGDNVSFDEFG